ncbi:MAG: HAD family hydrolase [Desulfobacteraceae bacterium]|nr:HAD family hydrolase [Desulfobacteraceae bacterium]
MSRIYQHKKLLSVYDTILFDLDGTLYNSDQFYTGAFEDMAQWLVQVGLLKSAHAWIDCVMGLKQARGNDYNRLIDDALALLDIDLKVKKNLLKLYKDHDCKYLELDPVESCLLDYLKCNNKKMFIITNGRKQLQERKIKRLGLKHYMKEIIILDPLTNTVLKPDRTSFDSLCKRYKPGKTIMVGDRFDIDGVFAQNADIDFIGVGFHGN